MAGERIFHILFIGKVEHVRRDWQNLLHALLGHDSNIRSFLTDTKLIKSIFSQNRHAAVLLVLVRVHPTTVQTTLPMRTASLDQSPAVQWRYSALHMNLWAQLLKISFEIHGIYYHFQMRMSMLYVVMPDFGWSSEFNVFIWGINWNIIR